LEKRIPLGILPAMLTHGSDFEQGDRQGARTEISEALPKELTSFDSQDGEF
jgi:hypothetical protein